MYTKTEVVTGLGMYDVYFKTCNKDVHCSLPVFRIEIPGINFQDQKYSNEYIRNIAELMRQYRGNIINSQCKTSRIHH
jgi:hypothetical protein